MRKYIPILLIICMYCFPLYGQLPELPADTVILMQDVQVSGYAPASFRWETPVSVGVLRQQELRLHTPQYMVTVVNTVSGVRMEERSPGSYRLSIRGSLVRSPYGVRNVKVYYNGFSLTDAGGNTYLNALNVSELSGIEILKGPDGSLYGANSGGIVFLRTTSYQERLRLETYGGAYGLAGASFQFARKIGEHYLTFTQSYQRADGYRQNSRNHRYVAQLSDQWQYKPGKRLELYAFYSHLGYKTPGGLTEEQYKENPRQARPATANLPGSVEQKTGITQQMIFGGTRHYLQLSSAWQHTISVWAHHVDFVYPFITNYETRNENNIGMRSWFSFLKENNDWISSLEIGYEAQRLVTDAYNYDNHAGTKGDIQAYDNILNNQSFAFIRGKLVRANRLTLEGGISINFNRYHFRDTAQLKKKFTPVWMPHLTANYRLSNQVAIRLTTSKGYSPPTTAEVRPSDNQIYLNLQPEKGWNIETGLRIKSPGNRFSFEGSLFYYLLRDGIVSQTNESGNTFFVNSGKIRQTGIEIMASALIIRPTASNKWLQSLRWNSSYTYSHFIYDNYQTNNTNHSGNRVAGVPRTVWMNNLHAYFPWHIYLFIQHTYTSRIPLNDANSIFADNYHLLSFQAGIRINSTPFIPSRIYINGENLLNQRYSSGADINAVGARYFNPAPGIHFQVGVVWQLE